MGPFTAEFLAWLEQLDFDYDERSELVRLEPIAQGHDETFAGVSRPTMCALALPWVTSESPAARMVGHAALLLWCDVHRTGSLA